MEDRHRLHLTELHTKLNTEMNNLEALKPGGVWSHNAISNPEASKISYQDSEREIKVWDAEMQALLARHKAEKLEMEWCRYALEELADPQTGKGASTELIYFKACKEQFLFVYGKLEKWGYKKPSEFGDDIMSIYTTFGEKLFETQRVALKGRFQELIADRSEWIAECGAKMALTEPKVSGSDI